MAKITRVEQAVPTIKTKKKVAAYARISMESERMNHSLSAQISYYSSLIQKNPDWQYAGVFADDGISGTGIAKRDEFKRMIEAADNGEIDIILTKSIQRFARNTVDLLQTVRHLKDIGVEVRFEKEHINSMSGDGELMLTILASFAQEESRSLSENCKWGIRKRFEKGIPNGHFRVYGYRWEGDDLVIVPEEAEIVKRIFQNFLDGKSRLETEREFAAEGITTRDGCRWVDSNIKVVLTNVTYTGNLLLQKEFISDPISKQRKKNRGQLPQYYVEDTHPAIIDKATFDYVQEEIARRKELGPRANKSLNLTCFSGMLKCPHCGISYDSAFFDRMHYYLPGWEIPKMRPEYFTNEYGLITDYLAEFFREMRKRNFGDAIEKYFRLGHDLNQRDVIGVRKTVSGMIKLLYSHGEFTKEDVAEVLEYALEGRRRVKEQLKKIGGMEFYDVHFSYLDNESFEEHFVSVPEQGSGKLIPEGQSKPGHVYTVAHGDTGMLGVYKLETEVVGGNGKFEITGVGYDREAKENLKTAQNYFKANKKLISGSISIDTNNFLMHIADCQGVGTTSELALCAFVALCGASLRKPVQTQMCVLGNMSIGGTISKVEELANTLQVCFDAGAKKILLPMSNAADIATVPADLFAKFQTSFYTSPEDAVFKALGIE